MQLSLQLSKLQGTTSYFDGNMGRVGVKSDTVWQNVMGEWGGDFTPQGSDGPGNGSWLLSNRKMHDRNLQHLT